MASPNVIGLSAIVNPSEVDPTIDLKKAENINYVPSDDGPVDIIDTKEVRELIGDESDDDTEDTATSESAPRGPAVDELTVGGPAVSGPKQSGSLFGESTSVGLASGAPKQNGLPLGELAVGGLMLGSTGFDGVPFTPQPAREVDSKKRQVEAVVRDMASGTAFDSSADARKKLIAESELRRIQIDIIKDLRTSLKESGKNDDVYSTPSESMSLAELETIREMLERRLRRDRYIHLTEDIIGTGTEALGYIFDGKTKIPFFNFKPDARDYHLDARVSMKHMRRDTGMMVDDIIPSGLSSWKLVLFELGVRFITHILAKRYADPTTLYGSEIRKSGVEIYQKDTEDDKTATNADLTVLKAI